MDIDAFRSSLTHSQPSTELPLALQALWWDAKGEWAKAHECAQAQEDRASDWVHAYLHRKEGDLDNAGYWYRCTGRPVSTATLDVEWVEIVEALLASDM